MTPVVAVWSEGALPVSSGVVRYDASQNHYDASRLTLVAELRHAIASGQLLLHYQPKVEVRSRSINGVAALVRWQHPTQGLLYLDRFIPLVEQTDLIDDLTKWVIARALSDLATISTMGNSLQMAVNVSAGNLGRVGFANQVIEALHDSHVTAERLTIEVTETALMADPMRAAESLTELTDSGVRISVDDFGSEQTSLGMLANLPIADLKIDRNFIHDIQVNEAHSAIVRSMVELGHHLELSVVAEGVETDQELGVVERTGCDLVQGFLYARPMAVEQLIELLAS